MKCLSKVSGDNSYKFFAPKVLIVLNSELSEDLVILNYFYYLLTHAESYYKGALETIVLCLILHQQGDCS